MTDYSALPQWKCHKIVRAAKIALTPRLAKGGGLFDVPIELDGGHQIIQVAVSAFNRGIPVRGDYLVVYDDGYVSWSPAKAFEEGYIRLDRLHSRTISDGWIALQVADEWLSKHWASPIRFAHDEHPKVLMTVINLIRGVLDRPKIVDLLVTDAGEYAGRSTVPTKDELAAAIERDFT